MGNEQTNAKYEREFCESFIWDKGKCKRLTDDEVEATKKMAKELNWTVSDWRDSIEIVPRKVIR